MILKVSSTIDGNVNIMTICNVPSVMFHTRYGAIKDIKDTNLKAN